MLNVLVTGATGFIGSRLVNYLKLKNCNIRVVSRQPIPNLETIVCDFFSDDLPEGSLINIDTVFHLAGYAHDLRDTNQLKKTYQKINVDVTNDLLSLSAKNNVKRFIYVSSVKAGEKCISKENQTEPDGVYGQTKREAELKVIEAGSKYGIHVSILRPALVYGPEAKGNLALMKNGINKGWFLPLPRINNKRSMVHVDDVVRALVFIANNKQTKGEVFIITDGNTYSSRDIYETMCQALGKSVYSWGVPLFLLNAIGLLNHGLRYKIDKLIGDECYSSEKLKSLGFKVEKNLSQMNETDF